MSSCQHKYILVLLQQEVYQRKRETVYYKIINNSKYAAVSTCKHDQTFYLIWYLHVDSKHGTYASPFVQYRYIPVCNTKQYIYKTEYVLLHHSRTFTNVYIGMGRTDLYV